MSRSLLRRISQRQTSSQNNRFPGTRARDSPKRRRHTRPGSILHLCIYRFSYSSTAWYFVVLSRAPNWLECVILFLFVNRGADYKRPAPTPVPIWQSHYSLKHFTVFGLLC